MPDTDISIGASLKHRVTTWTEVKNIDALREFCASTSSITTETIVKKGAEFSIVMDHTGYLALLTHTGGVLVSNKSDIYDIYVSEIPLECLFDPNKRSTVVEAHCALFCRTNNGNRQNYRNGDNGMSSGPMTKNDYSDINAHWTFQTAFTRSSRW